jgi:hypothetical protein
MTREDVIRMAREADVFTEDGYCITVTLEVAERFAALAFEAGAAAERNKLAAWMTQYGFATGHGDTMEQLCDALGTEIVDSIKCEVEAEREECAKVCEDIDEYEHEEDWATWCAEAIRARSNK